MRQIEQRAVQTYRDQFLEEPILNVRHYFEAHGFTRPEFYPFQPAVGAEVVT